MNKLTQIENKYLVNLLKNKIKSVDLQIKVKQMEVSRLKIDDYTPIFKDQKQEEIKEFKAQQIICKNILKKIKTA